MDVLIETTAQAGMRQQLMRLKLGDQPIRINGVLVEPDEDEGQYVLGSVVRMPTDEAAEFLATCRAQEVRTACPVGAEQTERETGQETP